MNHLSLNGPVIRSGATIRQRHLFILVLDIALICALLALWSIALTGLALHEWLGMALIGGVLLHVLVNWGWVVATTRRFARALQMQVRVNYLLNWALFVTMTSVLVSGVLISVVALPTLGLYSTRSTFLTLWHILSSDALLVVVGLHLGMNWRWVVTTTCQLWNGWLNRRAASRVMNKV